MKRSCALGSGVLSDLTESDCLLSRTLKRTISIWIVVIALLASGSIASAAEPRSPADAASDEARTHFRAGQILYEAGRYQDAIVEFQAAYTAKHLAAFDFNIARCEERLQHYELAIAAYERFLASSPPDEAEIRSKLDELKLKRTQNPPLATPVVRTVASTPLHDKRKWIAPTAVGIGAFIVGGIGAGLLGSAASDFKGLQTTCAPSCSPAGNASLISREQSGEALLAVAGALVVVDIILWIVEARRGRRDRQLTAQTRVWMQPMMVQF